MYFCHKIELKCKTLTPSPIGLTDSPFPNSCHRLSQYRKVGLLSYLCTLNYNKKYVNFKDWGITSSKALSLQSFWGFSMQSNLNYPLLFDCLSILFICQWLIAVAYSHKVSFHFTAYYCLKKTSLKGFDINRHLISVLNTEHLSLLVLIWCIGAVVLCHWKLL